MQAEKEMAAERVNKGNHRMDDNIKVISGSIVSQNTPLPINILESFMQSDGILQKGLLFVGGAGQGKTNVMAKVAADILQNADSEDVVVFFDVKGDYQEKFYQQGDFLLSPTNDQFLWNLFEDLKILPFGAELENRVFETVNYLFAGQQSAKDPFWVNAAKQITYCLILHMLFEADENDNDSKLNHREFCRLIDQDYKSYREILMSNEKFRSAADFLPSADSGSNMGFSIITEILVMKQRMFLGAFGKKRVRSSQYYISPVAFPLYSNAGNSKVLFLAFNPQYKESCAPVFRYFLDMMLAAYSNPNRTFHGRLYLILDELALLPELNRLDQALTFERQCGVRVMAGLQDIEQIRHNYQENPHRANVILGAFQSIVAFKGNNESIEFVQKTLGNAEIQKRYIRAGGGIGWMEPKKVETVERYEFNNLERGEAIVHLADVNPFKIHFPLYEIGKG